VTALVDIKGVPMKLIINKGNRHDARIAPKILNQLEINNLPQKKYMLGDKGYDSNKIREIIKSKKYKPIIAKRKYPNKKKSLSKSEIKIYRKRIIVENAFAWIKMHSKIDKYYEKTIKSYKGLLLLAVSIIIFKKC
jgi:transposase